ncbi:biotin-dependent carboxyltransferase family protein [Maritalea mediterranea]|uniref:Biotin-dependent carboxyltransferase family protein n=1 Tax=Maritalea mediterranea TaxID=2909667 RepID=A0ABS9E651_9HYPH|nr:biotin-dependent carboxyltransferase family protein [Maritalea mediterranea]MCF4098337.1 biotin-dependent carboxyltransferase family protein [Maritalea mediterranea]
MAKLTLQRVSPHSTVQDAGRTNGLQYGLSASGPMDRPAFDQCLTLLGEAAATGLEFTFLGLSFTYEGPAMAMAGAGGEFLLSINGAAQNWPVKTELHDGDKVDIQTGPNGMYGYVRFAADIDVPLLLGSKSTNLAAQIGGLSGRALAIGDEISLKQGAVLTAAQHVKDPPLQEPDPVVTLRVLPGLHADLLGPNIWHNLFEHEFQISASTDRMGVRLVDAHDRFASMEKLNLISDAVVPGDVQILGDGTPVILMRDHQPTGGYPRIATLIDKDLDRAAQLRPNTRIKFQSISLEKAHYLL